MLFGILLQNVGPPLNSSTGCLEEGKILDCFLLRHRYSNPFLKQYDGHARTKIFKLHLYMVPFELLS